MHRVLIVDSIAPAGVERLARAVEMVRAPDSDPETIRRLAREADGLITRSKLPDDLFSAAPRVRAVAIHGTGTDLVPLADATAMAMLVLARNVLAITNALRSDIWDNARALGAGTREIAGMTLGIVGVGAIGKRLAKIAYRGFGMRVLGNQRRLDRLPPEAEPAALAAAAAEMLRMLAGEAPQNFVNPESRRARA